MFGFAKKNDNVIGLNQKIGRFLSDLKKAELEAEHNRGESRMRAGVPCVLFLLSELEAPKQYAVGVSSDIALHGLAMYLQDNLDLNDYILVFGNSQARNYVTAKCIRCQPAEYGTHRAAFAFMRVLHPKEIITVSQAVRDLELKLSRPVASPIPAHVVPTAYGTHSH